MAHVSIEPSKPKQVRIEHADFDQSGSKNVTSNPSKTTTICT